VESAQRGWQSSDDATYSASADGGLGDAQRGAFDAKRIPGPGVHEGAEGSREASGPDGRGADINHWGSTWLACSDGTARRVEPSVPPLAYGLPRSVGDLRAGAPELGDGAESALRDARRFRKGVLRGAGNAIVPQVAALFVQAYMDTIEEGPE